MGFPAFPYAPDRNISRYYQTEILTHIARIKTCLFPTLSLVRSRLTASLPVDYPIHLLIFIYIVI